MAGSQETIWIHQDNPPQFIEQLKSQASDRTWSVKTTNKAAVRPLAGLERQKEGWSVFLQLERQRYRRQLGKIGVEAAATAGALIVRGALDAVEVGQTPAMEAVPKEIQLRVDGLASIESWSSHGPVAGLGIALWLQDFLQSVVLGAQLDVRAATPVQRSRLQLWSGRFDATLRGRWLLVLGNHLSAFAGASIGAGAWYRLVDATEAVEETGDTFRWTGVGSVETGLQWRISGIILGAAIGANLLSESPRWVLNEALEGESLVELPSPDPVQAFFRLSLGFD